MGSSSPSPPPPPPQPPPAPAITDRVVVENAARDAARRKRGRAATMLTGPTGDLSSPLTSTSAASAVLGRTAS